MNGPWNEYGKLSKAERSTLAATFFGWMLDGMDVMLFSFVMPTLIVLWGISQGEAGLLGTTTLLFSAFGGWMAGLAADRFGRVKVLQITIIWFSLFTFLSGFTDSFGQLMITRSLQGLGFGGEWAVGSVLIAETIRARHRGKGVGFVQSGWAIGWGLAALLYTLLFSVLEHEIAWRVMFWAGLLPALLVFFIRRHVPESEVFRRNDTLHNEQKGSGNGLQIFNRQMLRTTMLASLLSLGAQGGYYAITTWLPLFLRTTRDLSVMTTGSYLLVIISGSFCGYLVAAYMADMAGRRRTLIMFAVMSFVTVCLYMGLELTDYQIMLMGFPLGFFASGVFSPIGSFFTELFPTRMRGSGQGFAYNLGRGVGALFPAFVGFLSAAVTLQFAIGVFAGAAYLLMVAATLLLPETSGRELQ
ncbi:MAG TPA: MFS transporter [Woeseiaceae bacterium]|nr:MFS transporter [Woeseiaceae bacterium]